MEDRPLECSHCKKTIAIVYKEIEKGIISSTHMCESCPFYKKKLHGEEDSLKKSSQKDSEATLVCNSCQTSLETFLIDGSLGCSECYNVFSEVITQKLKTEGLIPQKLQVVLEENNQTHLHLGTTPNEELSTELATQVTDLNEALSDALQKENYEQAATLRDQIKNLKGNVDNGY